MRKAVQLERIRSESCSIHKWECPVWGVEHKSEEGATLSEFSENLYREGVRYKVMKYMQGVFCEDCLNDPEVQNSSV